MRSEFLSVGTSQNTTTGLSESTATVRPPFSFYSKNNHFTTLSGKTMSFNSNSMLSLKSNSMKSLSMKDFDSD